MSKLDKIMEKVSTGEMQYRDLVLSVREEESETPDHIVEGYASTYNEPSYLYRVKAPDGYTFKFQAFRHRDLEDPLPVGAFAERALHKQKVYKAYDDRKQRGDADVSHACRQSYCHDEEDRRDLLPFARRRAETDKAERARDRDPCADVAVDQHDHHLYDSRQDGQRDQKTSGRGRDPAI